jgi:diacylglycerol kinase (ATP)
MINFLKGFVFALKGIFSALLSEKNMKVHALAVVVVSVAGYYFHITATEWLAVIFCFALVISLEMVNTAIEILADKISPAKDEAIGKAKDIAAGAVLVAAIFSALVAMMVFGKYIF